MIYQAYQAQTDLMAPLRAWADLVSMAVKEVQGGPAANFLFRNIAAAGEIIARTKLTHERPAYGIETVMVDGKAAAVREEAVLETPFATLLHFRKETDLVQPRVLVFAPIAGHFPTLLRHTVKTLLADQDVFITDWKNARDIPQSAGRFGVDEYIDHAIRFIEEIGTGIHVAAVCQPCAALLAAVAVMAESDNAAQPLSMTLMAGPVDTRINPTEVNKLATSYSIEWFEKNLITRVPGRYAGAERLVYPGFLQLSAFLSMNLPRHMRAHVDLFDHLVKGDEKKADANRSFYDEYFAVSDLPAEFYLETVRRVFQEHHLPRGTFEYRGRKVVPAAIRRTSLLTIEGERDDICSVGQTLAAHDLCSAIKPYKKKHYVQPGVGHYGVFSGTRWQTQIYPIVRNTILASE